MNKARIEIDKDYISLFPATDCLMSDTGYNIERSRCNTPGKILGWMEHLAGKNWINTESIYEFTKIAFEFVSDNLTLREIGKIERKKNKYSQKNKKALDFTEYIK